MRSAVGRRPRVNRRQLHIARFPPGARRSDARSRANVARLPCRIPRNLCHVEEAILSLVAADDRNGAKMSTKGEARARACGNKRARSERATRSRLALLMHVARVCRRRRHFVRLRRQSVTRPTCPSTDARTASRQKPTPAPLETTKKATIYRA